VSVPHALIVGGPNGAGKTTFALEYVREHPQPYVSADAIAAELRPEAPYEARIEAGRRFFTGLERLIEQRTDFVAESTLSGRGMAALMDRLRAAGYTITVVFVFLDTADLCVRRVAERVRRGGHDVPEADVRRRFARSKTNFWNVYRLKADRWSLYLNAGKAFREIAAGAGDAYVVRDSDHFHQFLDPDATDR